MPHLLLAAKTIPFLSHYNPKEGHGGGIAPLGTGILGGSFQEFLLEGVFGLLGTEVIQPM